MHNMLEREGLWILLPHGGSLRVQGKTRETGQNSSTEWPQGFLGGLAFG